MLEARKPVEAHMNLVGDWVDTGLFIVEGNVISKGDPKYCEYSNASSTQRALPLDLMDRIVSLSNLVSACQRVVSNSGSPGVDGMSVSDLSSWFPT